MRKNFFKVDGEVFGAKDTAFDVEVAMMELAVDLVEALVVDAGTDDEVLTTAAFDETDPPTTSRRSRSPHDSWCVYWNWDKSFRTQQHPGRFRRACAGATVVVTVVVKVVSFALHWMMRQSI